VFSPRKGKGRNLEKGRLMVGKRRCALLDRTAFRYRGRRKERALEKKRPAPLEEEALFVLRKSTECANRAEKEEAAKSSRREGEGRGSGIDRGGSAASGGSQKQRRPFTVKSEGAKRGKPVLSKVAAGSGGLKMASSVSAIGRGAPPGGKRGLSHPLTTKKRIIIKIYIWFRLHESRPLEEMKRGNI